jgi:hypothetical protein
MGNTEGLSKLVNETEIVLTDDDIRCLEFGIHCCREAGCEKEVGVKAVKFSDAGFKLEQYEKLIRLGYFSNQMIFADVHYSQKCSLAGEQGTRNISGRYLAVTEAGAELILD